MQIDESLVFSMQKHYTSYPISKFLTKISIKYWSGRGRNISGSFCFLLGKLHVLKGMSLNGTNNETNASREV